MHSMRTVCLCLLLLPLAAGCAGLRTRPDIAPRNQVCAAETCFLKNKNVHGRNLVFRGTSILHRAFLQVYQVALYAPRWVKNERQMLAANVPKSIIVEYDRDVDLRQIISEVEENLPPEEAQDPVLRAGLTEIAKNIYPIHAEERHEFIYEPGVGTTLIDNGVRKLTIRGERFGRIFFDFWLNAHNDGRSLLGVRPPLAAS